MDHCFVIQPFDGGAFDKRFDDVLVPAIKKAGLDAYRVDRDPSVTVPIDSIESGIREARACVADITSDNPNVWFELGYALASRQPVVLICSAQRATKFPFDIQHRHVITYKTDSTSDFDNLGAELTTRLQAALAKEARVESLAQATLRETEGLEPHEIAALVIIAESDLDPEAFPSANSLKQDMSKAGYREIATVLAVNSLRAKKLVTSTQVQTYHGDSYTGFCLLDGGTEWLLANRNRLALRKPLKTKEAAPSVQVFDDFSAALEDSDDELPF
jgi:hypothetical protein